MFTPIKEGEEEGERIRPVGPILGELVLPPWKSVGGSTCELTAR